MRIIEGKLTKPVKVKLKIGQEVLYSGTIYTARDQAHKRLNEAIQRKKKLPIDLKGAIIYYTGPTPSKFKNKVGSAGPTTS
ncbi:MAG: fumarate hydratase C-terminal domain-containing protein, partial [Candidatus Omnitrophica bacterium]|nr:fumarate hydratase C-terminal domain-containing protein [Candidatus Omnitrophota bacterium]